MAFVERIIARAQARRLTISPDASVLEAAALVLDGSDMILACCDGARLMGVITKNDLMRIFVKSGKLDHTLLISSIMQRQIVSCGPEEKLDDVWRLLNRHKLRHLPVQDHDGCAIGVLSEKDILSGLLAEAESEEKLLKEYVLGVGYRLAT